MLIGAEPVQFIVWKNLGLFQNFQIWVKHIRRRKIKIYRDVGTVDFHIFDGERHTKRNKTTIDLEDNVFEESLGLGIVQETIVNIIQ